MFQALSAGQQTLTMQVRAVRRTQRDDKRRRLDCWSITKRTKVERAEFRAAITEYYNCLDPAQQNHYICMVLHQSFHHDKTTASHIYKHADAKNLDAFGIDPLDVNDPRNGFLLATPIERQFDAKHLCFLYDPFNQQLRLRILNPSLFEHPISAAFVEPTYAADAAYPNTEFGLLDLPHYEQHLRKREQKLQAELAANPQHQGVVQDLQRVQQKLQQVAALPQPLQPALLRLQAGHLPWKRLLGYHARCSFDYARINHWITEEEHNQFKEQDDFVTASQGNDDPDTSDDDE